MTNEGDSFTYHTQAILYHEGQRFGGQSTCQTFSIGVGLEWSTRNDESGNKSKCSELHGDEGQGETFIQKVGVFYMVPNRLAGR
jgi:hypothetical protein